MIECIKFRSGYPTRLPYVGDKLIEFKPGINILFGPNGCGKSTILNTLKTYCSIANGGWTHINNPDRYASKQFPLAYMGATPGQCVADVAWDGTPSFYNNGEVKLEKMDFFNTFLTGGASEESDGITSEADKMELLAEKPSSGQYRIKQMNKVLNEVRKIPDYSQCPEFNPRWPDWCVNEWKYWRSLPRTGPQTILLDEPERALSIPLQKKIYEEVLSDFSDLQIILATHCGFALNMKNVNFIEFEEGYIDQCRKAFNF